MFRPVFLLIFCLLAGPLTAQTTLRYNLHKGETFTIKQESVQETSRQHSDGTQLIEASLFSVLDFKVLEAEHDHYLVEVQFKALGMSVRSNTEGTLFQVDASKPSADNPQSKVFSSLLNLPFTIILDTRGDVLQVNGGDLLVKQMLDAAGSLDELEREDLKHSLNEDFGPEALARNFEQMTYIYPERTIGIGGAWENHYPGPTDVSTRWKLTSVTNGMAKIQGKASVRVKQQEPEVYLSMKGTRDTELTAELSSGFITTMKVTDHSVGSTTLAGWEDSLIPTVIQSSTTYKRI